MSKLLIFDCDGVLVDSEVIANRIDAEALTSLGYALTTEDSIRRFTGMNAETVRQLIKHESGIDLPPDYLAAKQPILFRAFETELSSLIKPVLEAINEMKISLCVASSSPRTRVMRCLEMTEQLAYFTDRSIFTSEQVSKGKPAPDLFLFAADQMGFKPADCIVIEDSSAGIEAAIAAGMQVVGFLGGSHARYDWYRQKINIHAVPVANHGSELLHILKDVLCFSIPALAAN